MNFESALSLLKGGRRIARSGWNGKGMWVALVEDWFGQVSGSAAVGALPPEATGTYPFIVMLTADKRLVPWLASQTDILANDWCEV